jgi:predicted Zn-dependent protease
VKVWIFCAAVGLLAVSLTLWGDSVSQAPAAFFKSNDDAYEQYLRDSLQKDPSQWKLSHCLAFYLRSKGHSEGALPLAERAARLVRPRDGVVAYINLARCLMDLGREPEAEEVLRRLLADVPNAPAGQECLDEALQAQGKWR